MTAPALLVIALILFLVRYSKNAFKIATDSQKSKCFKAVPQENGKE